jgi:hypothetical protein
MDSDCGMQCLAEKFARMKIEVGYMNPRNGKDQAFSLGEGICKAVVICKIVHFTIADISATRVGSVRPFRKVHSESATNDLCLCGIARDK